MSSMILMIAELDGSFHCKFTACLDSYWLMIHVAVIVGSYGPFALGMIIGVVSLLFLTISRKSNRKNWFEFKGVDNYK